MCFIQTLLVFLSARKRKNDQDPLLVWVHPSRETHRHRRFRERERERETSLRHFWVCSLSNYIFSQSDTSTVLQQTETFLTCKMYLLNWQTYVWFMAQFVQDKKNICLSPLTTVHIFSEIKSHGGPPEGEGLHLSIVSESKLRQPQWCHYDIIGVIFISLDKTPPEPQKTSSSSYRLSYTE